VWIFFIKYQWIENSFSPSYKESREGSKRTQVTSTLYPSKYTCLWYLPSTYSSTNTRPYHSTNEKNCLLHLCSYSLFTFCPIFVNNIQTSNLGLLISGFRFEVDENYTLQGHYTASSGNSVPTFCDNLSVPSSMVKEDLEDWTDRLSRNVGKKAPLYAAYYRRSGQISSSGIVDTTTVFLQKLIFCFELKLGFCVYSIKNRNIYFITTHSYISEHL
jgi:hypothetical protein